MASGNYILTINLSNKTSVKEDAKETLNDVTEPEKKKTSKSEEDEDSELDKFKKTTYGMATIMMLDSAKSIASSVVNTRISTIGARYDNQAKQNEIQNLVSIGGMASSTVSSAITGAVVGSSVSPAGAIVGAVIGVTTNIANQVYQIYERVQEWERNQFANNMEEKVSAERIGRVSSNRNGSLRYQ